MDIKPEYDEALEVEVNGYGCNNDCITYWFNSSLKENCTEAFSSATCPFW